ncbi:D-alanyl-D-alanine carboxypeptidase [Streptomyces sp. NPDC006645]|uniref:D-alanyl-D-alanine carboxypeptidase family protein n=1 Tax=unclassified Streptomyces TaxID=2593676 RepID=UPI0033AC0654
MRNAPRPGAAHPFRRRLAVLMTAAVGTAVIGLGGTWAFTGHGEADDLSPGARSLPWPADGQASVWVEGVGSLGTKGEQKPVPIASVTKVMTAYVILKEHPLPATDPGPVVTVDRTAAQESGSVDESTVRVDEGQRLTQRQLLELTLIPSGNNIARLLARWDAGSQEAFVLKMNREAARLGMRDTTYTGASGLEATSRSTSVDQLRLARAAMRDEALREIVAMPGTVDPATGAMIPNTNTLLGRAGVIGLKTGSSTPAGGALMWAATARTHSSNRLILGVVLHQRPDTTPRQGLRAALDSSGKLIEGARKSLGTAVRAQSGVSSSPRDPDQEHGSRVGGHRIWAFQRADDATSKALLRVPSGS